MKYIATAARMGVIIGSVAIIMTLTVGGAAFAQTTTATPGANAQGRGWGMGGGRHAPGVFGTVASISGTTLTVTSKGFGASATPTTYTVDASNATVTKSGTASTVGAIAVGDTVMVQGTVSGTNVKATAIRDGFMGGPHGGMMGDKEGNRGEGAAIPNITGNGEPVIGGTVASISGMSLTVTNKSNVTYTVDASNATVDKSGATSTISSIAVGDNVIVQGTVNGTAVVATSVVDQGVAPATPTAGSNTTGSTPAPRGFGGFLGGLGGFFQHLFGFL